MKTLSILAVGACALSIACGADKPAPQSPPPSGDLPASTAPTAPTQPPPPVSTVEISNTCDKDVTFHYGPQAVEGSGKESTLAPHMTTTIPREGKDTFAVWLINKGGAMAKVTITPRMKKVEVGKSCWTLDAHE